MKKEIVSADDLKEFVTALYDSGFAVDVLKIDDGNFAVRWVEKKTYTSVDGKIHDDEIWMTKDEEMLNIQDIEPEHARNIIRMIIRQDRATSDLLRQLSKSVLDDPSLLRSQDSDSDWGSLGTTPTIH